MGKAIIFAGLLAVLMLFGCLGGTNGQQTGPSKPVLPGVGDSDITPSAEPNEAMLPDEDIIPPEDETAADGAQTGSDDGQAGTEDVQTVGPDDTEAPDLSSDLSDMFSDDEEFNDSDLISEELIIEPI